MSVDRPGRGRPPLPVKLLVLVLAAVTVPALPSAVRAAGADPLAAAGWIGLVSLAGLRTVWLGSGIEFSVRTPVSAGLAVVLDPALTLFVTLFALVSRHELRRGHNPWMIAFNHLQLGFCGYAAAVVAHRVEPWPLGVMASVVTYGTLNPGLAATATWLLGRRTLRGAVRAAIAPFPRFATNFVVLVMLAVLVVVLIRDVGPWSIGLLGVPMWLGFAALHSAKQASDRADELAARVRELEALSRLGTALLSAREAPAVAALATDTLRALCAQGRADVAVDLDGRVPAHLDANPVPGTGARVGLPPDLGPRRAAEASTVLSTVGLALQRLSTEEELRAAQRAQAALAERILAEGAIARSRVALHVHDDVLPFLAAAQIQADNAATAARGGNPALTARLSEVVRDAIADGIRTLREVLDDLQRQTLLPGDLLPWLRGTAERLHIEHGLRVELDLEQFRADLSHAAEILLAEAANGLIANVVQHARASELVVRLGSTAEAVDLELRDDGVGFDATRTADDSHGLALLRQRVALVGGRLHVRSEPGTGTTVHLHMPLGGGAPRLAGPGLAEPWVVGEQLAQGGVLRVGV